MTRAHSTCLLDGGVKRAGYELAVVLREEQSADALAVCSIKLAQYLTGANLPHLRDTCYAAKQGGWGMDWSEGTLICPSCDPLASISLSRLKASAKTAEVMIMKRSWHMSA